MLNSCCEVDTLRQIDSSQTVMATAVAYSVRCRGLREDEAGGANLTLNRVGPPGQRPGDLARKTCSSSPERRQFLKYLLVTCNAILEWLTLGVENKCLLVISINRYVEHPFDLKLYLVLDGSPKWRRRFSIHQVEALRVRQGKAHGFLRLHALPGGICASAFPLSNRDYSFPAFRIRLINTNFRKTGLSMTGFLHALAMLSRVRNIRQCLRM